MFKYCTNMEQILYNYWANIVQLLCKYCTKCCVNIVQNIVQILFKYFENIVKKNWANILLIVYKYFINFAQTQIQIHIIYILHNWCSSINQILSQYCRTKIKQILHKFCENIVSIIQTLSNYCPNKVLKLCKHCTNIV